MSKREEPITFGKHASQKASPRVRVSRVLRGKILKLAVLAALVLVLGVGLVYAGMWAVRGVQQDKVDKAIATGTKLAEEAKPEGVADEAQAQAANGDVAGADNKLQAAIAAATSNEEKHQLMVQRAVVALNAGQTQQALTVIAEAEKLGSTKASSDTGAIAAEDAKNRPLAVEYLNKSLQRLNKSDPLYEKEKQNIQEKIAELQK